MSKPSDELPDVKSIDRLIHEPVRLLIMANLYVVDTADFLYLMKQLNLTFGNLSSHMSKLEEAGYVSIEKAREDYGVVLDPATLKVDPVETDKIRGSRKEKQVER